MVHFVQVAAAYWTLIVLYKPPTKGTHAYLDPETLTVESCMLIELDITAYLQPINLQLDFGFLVLVDLHK